MEQPIHDQRIQAAKNPVRRFASIGVVVLLHIGLIYALAVGLARNITDKVLEDLAVVDVVEEKVDDKPPPPPPDLEKPPPPVVPPPDINIAPDMAAPAQTIVTTTVPVAAPKMVGARPKSRGRDCLDLYPAIEQRLQQTGNTLLAFTITASGGVTNISVAQSSGYPRLDEAAVQCASRWSYTPATKDGVPSDVNSKAIVKWTIR